MPRCGQRVGSDCRRRLQEQTPMGPVHAAKLLTAGEIVHQVCPILASVQASMIHWHDNEIWQRYNILSNPNELHNLAVACRCLNSGCLPQTLENNLAMTKRLNHRRMLQGTALAGMRSTQRTLRPALLLAVIVALANVFPLHADTQRTLRRSDVVFFIDNPKAYEAYGCTVVGWGGDASADRVQLAHQKGVRLYATAIAFRTAFHKVIDFSDDYLDAACRDFSGEPFAVPWLWDQEYKGQPVWWGCTNSPLYREFLEDWLAEKMEARPDGLHIDDYSGTAGSVTWLAGGFCRHCLTGFRQYLADHVDKQKLEELGITDLAQFDKTVVSNVTPQDGSHRIAVRFKGMVDVEAAPD